MWHKTNFAWALAQLEVRLGSVHVSVFISRIIELKAYLQYLLLMLLGINDASESFSDIVDNALLNNGE